MQLPSVLVVIPAFLEVADSLSLFARALPAVMGFLGVLAGAGLTAWLAARRERRARRAEFLGRQLRDFYGPMLALRREIRAHAEMRARVSEAADAAWRDLVERARAQGGAEATLTLRQDRWPEFERIIAHDNEQLRERDMPAYHEMLRLFREHLSLADAATVEFYPELVEFVDVWDRHLAGGMPREVVTALQHTEQRLAPFYAHLEQHHALLRAEWSAL